VVEIYGADAGEARSLSSDECFDVIEVTPVNTILRAGTLGDWAFCVEFDNPIGFLNSIVRDLSRNTEAIVLLRTARAFKQFNYVVNGQLIESFEPGTPSTTWGRSEYDFSRRVHEINPAPTQAITTCLDVIAEHIGHELTAEILRGPLLSAVVDAPDRAALARPDPRLQRTTPPGTASTLGRRLSGPGRSPGSRGI
jgi:hypothetical protein